MGAPCGRVGVRRVEPFGGLCRQPSLEFLAAAELEPDLSHEGRAAEDLGQFGVRRKAQATGSRAARWIAGSAVEVGPVLPPPQAFAGRNVSQRLVDDQMVGMTADAERTEKPLRLHFGDQRGELRGDFLLHTVVPSYSGKQGWSAVVAAVRSLEQRQVARVSADRGAGEPVFLPPQRHVVAVGRQSLVELTGERKAGRARDVAGEHRRHHHPHSPPRGVPQQPAGREDRIVEMRRHGEQGGHSRWGSARNWVLATTLKPWPVPYTPKPVFYAQETRPGAWMRGKSTVTSEQLLKDVATASTLNARPLLLFDFASDQSCPRLNATREGIAQATGCSKDGVPCIQGNPDQL